MQTSYLHRPGVGPSGETGFVLTRMERRRFNLGSRAKGSQAPTLLWLERHFLVEMLVSLDKYPKGQP